MLILFEVRFIYFIEELKKVDLMKYIYKVQKVY